MTPRTRCVIGVFAAMSVVAGACGTPSPSAGPSAASSPRASATASAGPAAGPSADFRFAISGEPTYFSPASGDAPTGWVNRLLYTGLYRVNNAGDVVPDLATAMPAVSADGLTLTISMRTDARWHDGSPVTSSDAAFTFDLAMSPKCSFDAATCSIWAGNVGSVQAPTPDTLVINLKRKYAGIYTFGLTQGLVPKSATQASYARFVAASAVVDPAAVKALAARIAAAVGNPACAGAEAPGDCSLGFFEADMEATLTAAGIALPDKARFVGADGQVDGARYDSALLGQLTDLDTTLQAAEPDRLPASYRLLDINLKPVGSGPYMFVRYTPGQSVELARFDGYYLFKPGPATVQVVVIKDATAAAQALLSGKIDWEPEISTPTALAALKSSPTVRLSEYPDLSYVYLAFNVRPGHVFSDAVARQAFVMCIDHDATVRAATAGTAVPVNANVPPGSFFFDPSVPAYPLDVAGAKALLESSGYTLANGVYEKAGKALTVDLYVRADRPQRVKFAQLAAHQLAACGFDITVQGSDYSTVLLPLLAYPNAFDLYLGSWSSLIDPEDSTYFGCKHVTSKANPFDNNFTGFCDPKLDALMTSAAQELDRTKRKAILAQVQAYLHDKGPYYFLWADLAHRGYSTNVATNGAEGPIDFNSPYDWWNLDSWIVNR
jgi:ABC-type transport system substrate-binding protein